MAIFSKITSRNTHNSTNGSVRKKDVVFDTSISPTFPDFSYGQDDTILVKGGITSFCSFMDLPVALKPSYGDATIKDYQLGLNITSISQSPSAEIGSYQVYKTKNALGNNEGDMDIDFSNLMVYCSYVDDEPNCDFWREDFNGPDDADTDYVGVGSVTTRKTRPYLDLRAAFENKELTLGLAIKENSGNKDGILGTALGVLEDVAGSIVTFAQPQTITERQMYILFSDIGGAQRMLNEKARQEAKVFLKTDPKDSAYYIPAINRAPGGTLGIKFTPPKWKKSKLIQKNLIKYFESSTATSGIGNANRAIEKTFTFFDKIRNVNDMKFVSNEMGGNTDESEFANSRIQFTTGLSGKALEIDQWISHNNAGETTGTIASQPKCSFNTRHPNSANSEFQDVFLMKRIPKPVRLSMDDKTGQGLLSEADAESALSTPYTIDMDINFKNLDPMFRSTASGGTGGLTGTSNADNNPYRGFFITFSCVPPQEDDSLTSFLMGILGKKTTVQGGSSVTATDMSVSSGVGSLTVSTDDQFFFNPGTHIFINSSNNTYDEEVVVESVSGGVITYSTSKADLGSGATTATLFPRSGPLAGFYVVNDSGKTRMTSLTSLLTEGNSGHNIVDDTTQAFHSSLKMNGENANLPLDTWLNIKIMTDEEGPDLDGTDASGGMFNVVVSGKDGKLLHDEEFRLKDATNSSASTFRTDAQDHRGVANWPTFMCIWQVNIPSKAGYASSNLKHPFTLDALNGTGKNDTNLFDALENGDEANDAIRKNRRTRVTTCIDHIHINATGHLKYQLPQNDSVLSHNQGYITKNTPIPALVPDFTNGILKYNYSPCNLSFGFKNQKLLHTIADSTGAGTKSGFFLMGGFLTSNVSDKTHIPDNNLAAGVTDANTPAIMGQHAHFDYFKDDASTSGVDIQDSPDYSDANPIISVGYDASNHKFAVEGFTQKGTIRFKEGSDNVLSHGDTRPWVKRENLFCSSRIVNIIDPVKGIFEVDDPKVFEADADERFIIYTLGETFDTADQLDSDGDNGDNTWVAPVQILNLDDRRVTIKAYTDENEGTQVSTFANLLTDAKMNRLMISPYRYWLDINIIGEGEFPERSYKSILPINNFASPGATFNESDFFSNYDGSTAELTQYYYNSHDFNVTDPIASALELDKDYGFGTYENNPDIETSGGYCGKFQPIGTGVTLIDLPEIQKVDRLKEDETLSLFIKSAGDESYQFRYNSSNFTTDTTKRPFLVTRFEDELPTVQEFKVVPDEESDGFYPKFTWNTSDSDLWYGFLSINNTNIYSQYTDAVLHFPLNEEGEHSVAAAVPFEKIKQTTNTISGAVYDMEGLAGNALRFDGNNDYVECNNSAPNDPTGTCTTEMSVVAHIIPDSGANDQQYVVAQASRSNLEKFHIRTNTSNQVEARVHYGAGSSYVDVTSGVAVVKDGEQPTVIMLTVDTTLSEGNVKLFVNGKLEAQSGVASTSGSTTAWKIGQNIHGGSSELYIGNSASSGSNGFAGLIEEVVVYDTCLYPVDVASGEAVIKKEFSELTASALATSKPLNARLFIKDYHNIRGSVTSQVCTTPQVSWRKAGFRLDMS